MCPEISSLGPAITTRWSRSGVKDRAALVYAKVTIERDLKLLNQGIVSQAQTDTDRSAFDRGKAQIELDIAAIASKKATLRAAEPPLWNYSPTIKRISI